MSSSKAVGIEEARKVLGDLVTAAQQGTDVILTRNRRPVARVIPYQEVPVITVSELAVDLGFSADDAAALERVARFAGAFRVASDYAKIGQIPPRWAGQGTHATFTEAEADELASEWRRTAKSVRPDGSGALSPVLDDPHFDAQEVARRYWR